LEAKKSIVTKKVQRIFYHLKMDKKNTLPKPEREGVNKRLRESISY